MTMTTRMDLACLLVVLVVLVFEAADASLVTRVHLAPTPNSAVASRSAFANNLTKVASPQGANPEAPSPSARLKDEHTEIGHGSMNRDGIPCNDSNCQPSKSGGSPAEHSRCCRKMLLEAHTEGDDIADNVSEYFGGLKDYLTSKLSR